jgi:hypothetical protein
MATKIIHKKSSVAEKVPLTTDLEIGELAINLADKKLFSKDSNGNIIEFGSVEVQQLTVYNGTGSTITKGSVVYINGAQGQKPSIALASNASEATSSKTFGFVVADIANGAEGAVTTEGLVYNLNTLGLTEGGAIYLGATAGSFTQTKPVAPAHLVSLGWVVKANASSGRVLAHVQNGFELDEIHDVLITSPANTQVLAYETSSGLWKNSNLDWANVQNKPDPVITLAGDLSGSVTLTDLASGTLTATIAANSVALGTDTTGNYVGTLAAGTSGAQTGSSGLTISATAGEGTAATIAHADTSSQASVDNSNGVVIQDVTLDTYGHVTALGSVDLDSRYYTESEIQTSNIPMRSMTVNANGVPTTNLGTPTVAEMALFDAQFDNKTERHPITSFWIETSTDNSTWTEAVWSDTNKRLLVGGDSANSAVTIPYGTPYFRIRLRALNYVYLNALYAYFSTSGHTTSVQMFKKHDSGAWTQHTSSTAQVSSWPGHLYLPFSTIPWHPTGTLDTHFHEVYVLFTPTWNATYPSNPIAIYKTQIWGGYPSGRRNLYSTSELGDASFPGAIGVANGTAAAPAFDFNSDTNTGIYLAAADTLGFSTNGTAAAEFTSTGNLRLYNTAGTFYSEFSNQPTANRTISFPDGNVTLQTGTAAITSGNLSQFAATTSSQLAGVISDETGSGSLVFATSPALAGTPTAPTATAGTNTTQLATTAFVTTAANARVGSVTGTAPIVSSGGTTPAISITAATTSAAGSMSAADKTKLDGIAANANNYSLPAATSTVIGGVELFSDTVQTVAANAVTATASRTYGVQVNADGQAVVNVPWVDTDTTLDSTKLPLAGGTMTGAITFAAGQTWPTFNQNTTGSAATLTTARTISLSGAATGTATSFNGSVNITIPVTDLNASNLSSGTVPDARIAGTYSGFTHKIDGFNTIFTTPNSGSTNTSARTVYGLAEYRSSASAQVGAIVFIAPTTATTIMHQLDISGLLYNQNIVAMTVQGYRNAAAWADVRKISTGTVDVQTRWAVTPDGKQCLILGDVGTSWSYPHFSITKAMFSHNGVTDAYCSGWTVAIVTDLSTYTQVTSTIADSNMVGSITGNAATATTTTNVAVTTSATASAFKVPFANTTASATGNYGLLQDSEATFTYNPSTNTLALTNLTASGDINTTSDQTLKENVVTISNALDKVSSLRGVEFDWKSSGKHSVGVIAQEVEQVFPELVTTTEEGIKAVAYANLVGVLIEAVKELKEEIKQLKQAE